MINGDKLDIALGRSARSRKWKNTSMLWPELAKRLSESTTTNETLKEFLAANKAEQLQIKDVGGYVGGYLRAGKRSRANVVHRQVMTLDIDFAPLNFWEDFVLQFDFVAVLHSTHKHTEAAPRYRLVLPMSREATPDEYAAASRQLAGQIGIELFDSTTFETHRLMFWPSTPKDKEYYYRSQVGPWVDVDELLGSYADWTDSSLWPTAEKEIREIKDAAAKQQDPREKKGVIGAFCKAHTISEAIATYLPEIYEEAGPDRYTYKKGTAAAGLMVYDDTFAYSHHGTDPCGGKLCNAFDLVRVHLFGHLDAGSKTTGRPESVKAMEDLAIKDKASKQVLASESFDDAQKLFAAEDPPEEPVEVSTKWTEDLEIDGKGKFLSSANNLNLIFSNDLLLLDKFKYNEFDGKRYLAASTPWRKIKKPEIFKDVDYSGVRNYIESCYGITGSQKVDDVLALVFDRRPFHPIRDFLDAAEWDGAHRISTLLVEYFGVVDNEYTRAAITKTLVGAVARIYEPGVKFDLILTLAGAQGLKKSMFLDKLGGAWFSDSFSTVKGKEAFEQLRGSWIIEIAELAGLRKAEIEAVKHFFTKREDIYRPAWGRVILSFPRQCIFVGTTNNAEFLKDPTGNRRFLPVDVRAEYIKKDPAKMTRDEISQIWAEAVELYRNGEKLYLDAEVEEIATAEQRKHSDTDERTGIIEDYLNRQLPDKWGDMGVFERHLFIEEHGAGKVERDFVCVAEVWCECLGKKREDMDKYVTRPINDIMRSLDGWTQHKSTKNFKLYGKQKYYSRENNLI